MANVSKMIFGTAIAAVSIASWLDMLPKAIRQFLFITGNISISSRQSDSRAFASVPPSAEPLPGDLSCVTLACISCRAGQDNLWVAGNKISPKTERGTHLEVDLPA